MTLITLATGRNDNIGACASFFNHARGNMDPVAPGPIYTAEQIKIPAELPDLFKEFAKAAIRTQPPDLLQWSAA